jgi:hypothetical protein
VILCAVCQERPKLLEVPFCNVCRRSGAKAILGARTMDDTVNDAIEWAAKRARRYERKRSKPEPVEVE